METKFEDLPEAVQVIAAHALKEALTRIEGGLKSEPAKELARSINVAFTSMYEDQNGPMPSFSVEAHVTGRLPTAH